jgi:pimeloyl-ACP methyl ester carboxylesterase
MKLGVLAVAVGLLVGAAPATAAPERIGSVDVHPCAGGGRWLCGKLPRPLDPARPHGRRIGIAFRWLPPRRAGAGTPALVAVEGGPGFPSTGSRVEYTGTYGPLLRRRGLLLVDQRGTGGSALIYCRAVQNYPGVSSGTGRFPRVVAGCARKIARRYGSPDLFATAYATRDLAAVIRALRLGRVDLYGDSYGTYFVQSFMSRHQDLLHSVVLDSSYPVRDLDPWYVSSGTAARHALDAVCTRDLGCSAAGPGSATARLGELLARLRAEGPIAGRVAIGAGHRVKVRIAARALVDLVQDAGSESLIYRELDPAVRAALGGDDLPLLRMVAENRAYLHGEGGAPTEYSDGLYWAVACADYPELFSMAAAPAERRRQLSAALRSPPAGAFDPFTAHEWVTVDNYTQPYAGCLDWPRPRKVEPALPAAPRPLPASIPLLMIGGDLDSLTPQPDAYLFGPALAANLRIVALPNTTHVTSEGDGTLVAGAACARAIIRGFVRAPERLATLDTSCTRSIPPVHTAGSYPRRLADALPATLVSGPALALERRQAVTVAAGALADAPVRYWFAGEARGPGLRGGSFTAKGYPFLRLRLRRVRFAGDAAVSGTGSWRFSDGATRGTLTVRMPGGGSVGVRVAWDQRSQLARARVGGSVLTLPAP